MSSNPPIPPDDAGIDSDVRGFRERRAQRRLLEEQRRQYEELRAAEAERLTREQATTRQLETQLEIARELLANQEKLAELAPADVGQAQAALRIQEASARFGANRFDTSALPPEVQEYLTRTAQARIDTNTDQAQRRLAGEDIVGAPPGTPGGPPLPPGVPPPGPAGGTNPGPGGAPFHEPGSIADLVQQVGTGNIGAPLGYLHQRLLGPGANPILRGLTTGVGIGAGVFGGVPIAVNQANRLLGGIYGDVARDDITMGLQAGFSGAASDMGTLGSGLLNRLFAPAQILGMGGYFGGQAQEFGARRRVEAFKAGFNPFDTLSTEEAQSIQQEVLNRGYRPDSDQERRVRFGLYELGRNRPDLDPGVVLDYLDITVKKLGGGVEEMINDLEGMGAAARAAGKSHEEFVREAADVAREMASVGTDLATIRAMAPALGGVPNVPGQELLQDINNPDMLARLAMQIREQNPGALSTPGEMLAFLDNPAGAVGETTALEAQTERLRRDFNMIKQMFPDMTELQVAQRMKQMGFSTLDADKLLSTIKFGDAAVRDAKLRSSAQDLDQMLNVGAFETPIEPGDVGTALRRHMRDGGFDPTATDEERRANYQATNDERLRLLRDPRTRGTVMQGYRELLDQIRTDPDIKPDMVREFERQLLEEGKDPDEVLRSVQDAIAQNRGERSQSINVEVGLTDRAEELLRIVRTSSPGRVSGATVRTGSDRNSQNLPENFWRQHLPGNS